MRQTEIIEYETPKCLMCHERSTVRLEKSRYLRWKKDGEFAYNVWPGWSSEKLELIISGTHPGCWKRLCENEA